MGNRKCVILFVLVLITIAVFSGCGDSSIRSVIENEQIKPDESVVTPVPEPKHDEPAPEMKLESVSENQDHRQEEFNRLLNEEGVTVFAENGLPNNYLNDKSLFKIKVTDVMCNEKDIIEYLLNKNDKAYQMNSINFDSVFARHDALRELTGITHAGDYYCVFCKINIEIERIWAYDYEDTLSLDIGLFSTKYYSDILGEYSGANFNSNTIMILVDDCKSGELLFDEDKNSHQIEVITTIHYDEYSNDYDEYNVMFNETIVSNGKFNIRELNGG